MTLVASTPINFFDVSDGDIVEWNWTFGDEYSSTEQNPLHIYILPVFNDSIRVKINPYRTVTLSILTSDGCRSTYSQSINIYDGVPETPLTCKAQFKHFTLSYDTIAGTETFQFSNRSEGESLSYLWQADNGETSTDFEPTFTFDYSQPMHKVSLTITAPDGCTDSYGEDVFIEYPDGGSWNPGDSTYYGCFAAFGYTTNYTVKTFAPALVLDFYTKSDDEIVTYRWDFGDGYTSNEANPTHIFNYPINVDPVLGDPNPFRTVCLTATTSSGCESTWCQTIDIYTGKDPYNQECYAWFKYYVPEDIVSIPEVATYKFFSTTENVVSWTWYFEDGTVSYDPEPLVTFDIFKPTQQVCLTILTADSCTSKWCETIDVSPWIIDTLIIEPVCNYTFKYTSFYPEWASACIGTASAQVVLNDSAISTEYYYWTDESFNQISESQNVENLCPTNKYTVTALTTDGCKFSGSFIFNSDGTVTEMPVNWWIYGDGDRSFVDYKLDNKNYTVEWLLCDGTIVTGDSILLTEIDCGTNEANFFIKDKMGNVIYSENVTEKAEPVSKKELGTVKPIQLYPVPVVDKLNITYTGNSTKLIRVEVSDLSGRVLLKKNFNNVKSLQRVTLDLSFLQKGIYLGKVFNEKGLIAVEKFSK
jgi:PKD repeat protein